MNIKALTGDLRDRLNERKDSGDWRSICDDETGIGYSWLTRFANGEHGNPTIDKLTKLEAQLDKLDVRDKRRAERDD